MTVVQATSRAMDRAMDNILKMSEELRKREAETATEALDKLAMVAKSSRRSPRTRTTRSRR
jgi:hypothetical protein